MTKSVLIGTFVNKTKILSFIEFLKVKLKVNVGKIRVYKVKSNNYEYLVTFKAYDKEKYLSKIRNSTVLHVKNGCLFSINALNRMINGKTNEENKEYAVDWNIYKDKIIILTRNELLIDDIEQINDFSSFIFK
ncbi:MAG: hypothetical protein IKT40_07395 [Bacilli bacterium]|nr:hypothetical protein [Bacilli bacterium]